jgi:redox-sensitive bicupin YhaK (pirin superfamily)
MGTFDNQISADYQIKNEGNGVYVFVLEGKFSINGIHLDRRDGLGISETNLLNITSEQSGSEILLMEVPMSF